MFAVHNKNNPAMIGLVFSTAQHAQDAAKALNNDPTGGFHFHEDSLVGRMVVELKQASAITLNQPWVVSPFDGKKLVSETFPPRPKDEEIEALAEFVKSKPGRQPMPAPAPKLTEAQDFLQAAMNTIAARGNTYDRPGGAERSMARTVAAFIEVTGVDMTETQGWLFMAILKAVRSQQNQHKDDNYLDGAAYFALAGESAQKD